MQSLFGNESVAQFQSAKGIAMYPAGRFYACLLPVTLIYVDLGICGYQDESTNQSGDDEDRQVIKIDREFFLYQPQMTLEARSTGVEALLRWNCDEQVVSPADFITLLEKSRIASSPVLAKAI